MTSSLEWHGAEITRFLMSAEEKSLKAAARELHRAYRQNLNRPAVYIGGGRWEGSRPGEMPKKRTGFLRESVYWYWDRATRKVLFGLVDIPGADQHYGEILDIGSKRIRPRPWILVTVEMARARVEQEAAK